MKVFDLLENTAKCHPNISAFIDNQGALSYAELYKKSSDLAILLQEAGIEPGSLVALITNNCRDFVASLFALSKIGAVACPLGSKLSRFEYEDIFNDLKISHVIDDGREKFNSDSQKLNLNALYYQRLNKPSSNTGNVHDLFPDAVFVRPTSGTTGKSKGVVLSNAAVIARVNAAQQALKLLPGDKVLWLLPMAYHFVVSIVLYIKEGATILVSDGILAEQIINLANQHSANALYASPQHFKLLAACKSVKLPALKWAICTAGKVADGVPEQFALQHGQPLRQVFGIIELGLPIGNLGSNAPSHSIGQPLPGYSAKIQTEDGQAADYGQVGQLLVKGPGMFSGYLNPYATQKDILKDGWFCTGDLAVSDSSGNITIVGRQKAVINVAGQKVFAEEVESCILSFPGIKNVKAYSKASELAGEVVAADLVFEDTCIDPEKLINSLRAFCVSRLSAFKVPKIYQCVEKIELTGSGKVKR